MADYAYPGTLRWQGALEGHSEASPIRPSFRASHQVPKFPDLRALSSLNFQEGTWLRVSSPCACLHTSVCALVCVWSVGNSTQRFPTQPCAHIHMDSLAGDLEQGGNVAPMV